MVTRPRRAKWHDYPHSNYGYMKENYENTNVLRKENDEGTQTLKQQIREQIKLKVQVACNQKIAN